MRFTFATYPLRWVAPIASLLGAVLTLALPIDPMQNPDTIAFLALAKSLLSGRGLHYQEALIPGLDLYAFRAPGYPLLLAMGLPLGGTTVILAIQGALNGLSAALVGDIARRLAGGPRAAWIAFAIRLAWPVAWLYSGLLLSEIFYEFLGVLATWLVLLSIGRRQLVWILGAAGATVWAILCRPVGIGLAFALGIWLLVKFPKAAFVYAALTLLLWAPWPIRNAVVLHAFVPFTTNGGATAWAGTVDGNPRPAYDWMGAHTSVGEVGFDRHFRALAQQNVRSNPKRAVGAMLRRAFIYLGPIRGRAPDLWLHRFAMLGALVALVLGLWHRRLVLPGMIWAAQGAMMVPIFLIDRYRFPTEWCVVVAAAIGISGLTDRIGPRRAMIAVGVALVACIAGSFVLSLGGSH